MLDGAVVVDQLELLLEDADLGHHLVGAELVAQQKPLELGTNRTQRVEVRGITEVHGASPPGGFADAKQVTTSIGLARVVGHRLDVVNRLYCARSTPGTRGYTGGRSPARTRPLW